MRLMLVVQRYGKQIAGGSEQCCRLYAEHLVERGHRVEVVTSCATNYVDWANDLPAGESVENGVIVHRFPVDRIREPLEFGRLNQINFGGRDPVPLFLQERWIECMGPRAVDVPAFLSSRSKGFDAFVFFTYLYYPTMRGLEAIAGRAPSVFFPTAHREPPFEVAAHDRLFRFPDAFGFLTIEERELVRSTFGIDPVGDVLGVGVDLDASGRGQHFRKSFGLGDDPYLLYVGRVDPGKGSLEVLDYFDAFKRRNPGPLKLVVVGEQVHPVGYRPDVLATGFVDEQTRNDAIDGCLAYLQPSYFESFSMSLTEAWALRRPALVQGKCEVLVGQVTRAMGGLPYDGYLEFECAVDVLLEDPKLGDRLGWAGRKYVEANYDWPIVMDRTEKLINLAIERFSHRAIRARYRLGSA